MTTEPGGTPSDIPEALFREAVRWFMRLREGDVSPEIAGKFQTWLDADQSHRLAYEQAGQMWDVLDHPAKDAASSNEEAIAALIKGASRKPRLPSIVAIGGLGAVLCGAALHWWQAGGFDDLRATYVTPPGVHRQVVLDDGTRLDLNTDTSVKIDMRPDRRGVHVFRGEAFFAVAHVADRPFVVTTPDGETRDIGTAFNIRVDRSKTTVSLVEGEAEVTSLRDASKKVDLAPGQEVVVDGRNLSDIQQFQTELVEAWRDGKIVFYRTPLGDVVDELNRYQRGRIVILDESLRKLPVTGAFSSSNPAEAINVIEATLGVSATRFTGYLTILSR